MPHSTEEDRRAGQESDLGFGSVVARESRRRLLNRDGSFNVRREGLRPWESLSAYHYFLTISWRRFLALVVLAYAAVNALFAAIYLLCGGEALAGVRATTAAGRFGEAFFFSVHTLATIGYGTISPNSVAANVVVTFEALTGLFGLALVTGIVFARFARPEAKVSFSRNALIAPYGAGRALMFRIANRRETELVDVEAKVLLAMRKHEGSVAERKFVQLALERDRVAFFPLSWTIVHPIGDDSPLRDWTFDDLAERDAEFLILLNGFDESFSQTVHVRSSYKAEEVVWGAQFVNLFNPVRPDGILSVDLRKLDEYERVEV